MHMPTHMSTHRYGADSATYQKKDGAAKDAVATYEATKKEQAHAAAGYSGITASVWESVAKGHAATRKAQTALLSARRPTCLHTCLYTCPYRCLCTCPHIHTYA